MAGSSTQSVAAEGRRWWLLPRILLLRQRLRANGPDVSQCASGPEVSFPRKAGMPLPSCRRLPAARKVPGWESMRIFRRSGNPARFGKSAWKGRAAARTTMPPFTSRYGRIDECVCAHVHSDVFHADQRPFADIGNAQCGLHSRFPSLVHQLLCRPRAFAIGDS